MNLNYNTKFAIALIVCFLIATPIVLYLSNDAHPTEIETERLDNEN